MKVVAFKCDDCGVVTEIPVNKAIKLILNTIEDTFNAFVFAVEKN